MFLKVILYFRAFSFVQNAFLCFSSETGSKVFSRKMCLREIKKSHFHTKSLATTSQVFCD